MKHWDKIPPVSVTLAGIAAALGVKREEKKEVDAGNIEELARLFGGVSKGRPEWLTKTE